MAGLDARLDAAQQWIGALIQAINIVRLCMPFDGSKDGSEFPAASQVDGGKQVNGPGLEQSDGGVPATRPFLF
jgi:hypothetical protein